MINFVRKEALMPEISVIVPVYNVEKYVEKCLRSILGQTFRDLELIVVLDGSTDKSGEICDRVAAEDGRVRVVRQENQGQGGARNTGITQARGRWLMLVDSDDWIEPQALEKSLEAGEKWDADMVVFDYQTVGPDGKVLEVFREPQPKNTPLSPKEHKDVLFAAPCPWGKLYKTELFRRTGVRYPSRVWYEDLRVTPKLLAESARVVFIDYIGSDYFLRDGSTMFNGNIERNAEILPALDDILGYFKDRGLYGAYEDELCYLTLYHAYLAASVRVIRIDPKSRALLGRFRQYAAEKFPHYRQNKYIARLSRSQRLVLGLLERKQYGLIALLFKLKG